MVKKKVLVLGLAVAMLVGNGSVFASTEMNDGNVNTDSVVVSTVGVPAKVEGSHEFKCVIGKITVEQLANFLKTYKVLDSEGNDLGLSDQLFIADAKFKSIPLEKIVNSMNNATAYNYDLMIGLPNYYGVGTYALMVEDKDSAEVTPGNINYATHVQNEGWQSKVKDGKMSGTEGKSYRLEGIKIESGIAGVGVEYTTHVQDIGWQDYVKDGVMSGTSARSLRLEAIKIRLTGENAAKYDVYYRVHAQNVGWMGWASNDAESGTAGFGYRLEGIEIKIVEKGSPAPGSIVNPFLQNK